MVAPPGWTRPDVSEDGKPPQVPAVIRAVGEEVRRWTIVDNGGELVIEPQPVLRVSTLIVCDAVRAGVGAALFPKFFVRDDVPAGQLVHWEQS